MSRALRRLDDVVAAVEMAIIVVGLSTMVIAYFLLVVVRYGEKVGVPMMIAGAVMFVGGCVWFWWATPKRMGQVFSLIFGGIVAAFVGRLAHTLDDVAWADELCRFLLIWVAFAGASLATRYAKHLAIDVADKVLKGKVRSMAGGLAMLIAAGFAGGAGWICLTYVRNKLENCNEALLLRFPGWTPTLEALCIRPEGGFPEWIVLSILPVAFAIMSLRFVGLAVRRAKGDDVVVDEAKEAIAAAEKLRHESRGD